MNEKRVYVVSSYMTNLTESNIEQMSDDEFITIAEDQGWVWSSFQSFAESWNGDYGQVPDWEYSKMRIL